MNIQIAKDHHEGEEFAEWLNKNGHEATIGRDTSNYVDGVNTGSDLTAQQEINLLWDRYCLAQ